MKPTSAHNTKRADDDAQEQIEEGRSALQAAPRAPPHAAPSTEHKQNDSSSSLAESKQQKASITEPTPAPSAHRSKRVREPQDEAVAAAAAATAPASSSERSSKQARTAAASSVQHQSDVASARKNGSGRSGSRSEPEQGGEGEAAPEVAAAAASLKSVASSSSPAAAALPAVTRLSPCSRLDADSLGIALSCLDANEFLVARLVSKQWHAASAKRTAWPQLQVDDFIRLMQNDAYDDPSRRRLVVDSDTKLRSFVSRFSAHSSKDGFGKHASEIKFAMRVPCAASVFAARKTLLQSALPFLSQFQYLSTLTLHHCFLEDAAVVQLYTALEPRLRVLILLGCGNPTFYSQLSLLTQLRVLVCVDQVPPAEALRSLTALRYLHVGVPPTGAFELSLFSSNHGRVLRWLSVNHALRSLSVREEPIRRCRTAEVRTKELVATFEADANRRMNSWEPALPAPIALDPPLDWEVPARFTDLSVASIAENFKSRWNSFPDLRRLEFEQSVFLGSLVGVGVSPVLPRLTEIRIIGRFGQQVLSVQALMQELQACRNLRRFTFITNFLTGKRANPGAAAPIPFPPLLLAFSATIKEIRLGVDIRIAFQADGENEESIAVELGAWAALAACKQLRVLAISFSDSMPDSFLRALSSLPAFRSLELSFRGDQPRMPPTMLRRMLESTSWNMLRLESVGSPAPCDFNPLQPAHVNGLSQQLARLEAKEPAMLADKRSDRIRLFATDDQWRTTRTYCIVADESSGARVWESDERR